MSTVFSTSHLPATVARKLAALRRTVVLWLSVHGMSLLLLTLAGMVLLSMGLDWCFRMEWVNRLILLLLGAGGLVVLGYYWLFRPLTRTVPDDALVLRVESQHRELGQSLISAVQFSRIQDPAALGVSPQMIQATIDQGARIAAGVDFGRAVDVRFRARTRHFSAGVAVCAAVLGLTAATNQGRWFLNTWAARNLGLSASVEWPKRTRIVLDKPVTVVAKGDDWEQAITIEKEVPHGASVQYTIEKAGVGGRIEREYAEDELVQVGERTFRAIFKNVLNPFKFRMAAGDDETRDVAVRLVERPSIDELIVDCTPPLYAQKVLPPGPLPPSDGLYDVLKGSSLSFRGTANKLLSAVVLRRAAADAPVPGARVRMEVVSVPGQADRTGFVCDLGAADVAAGSYKLALTDREGYDSKPPTQFTLRIRPDAKPIVRARLEGISTMITPRATVPVKLNLKDDFAVADVALILQINTDGQEAGKPVPLSINPELKDYLGQPAIDFLYKLEAETLTLQAGTQTLVFAVEARDNDDVSGPNVGQSPRFFLKVVTDDVLRNELLRREQEQAQELERLTRDQQAILADTLKVRDELKRFDPPMSAEQRDLLTKTEKRQRLAGERSGTIGIQVGAILAELLNNKLEDSSGPSAKRLNEKVIPDLLAVKQNFVPPAANWLNAAWKPATDKAEAIQSLEAAADIQDQTVKEMQQILSEMNRYAGIQQAINQLNNLKDQEEKLRQDVLKFQNDLINRIFGNKNPKDKN